MKYLKNIYDFSILDLEEKINELNSYYIGIKFDPKYTLGKKYAFMSDFTDDVENMDNKFIFSKYNIEGIKAFYYEYFKRIEDNLIKDYGEEWFEEKFKMLGCII